MEVKIFEVNLHPGDVVGKQGLKAAFDASKVTAVKQTAGFRNPEICTRIIFDGGAEIETTVPYDNLLVSIGWKAEDHDGP